MSVWSDRDIVAAVRAGELGLSPFVEKGVTPNGYDLTLAEVVVPDVHGIEKRFREGKVLIPPKERFLVSTTETLRMPGDVCAQLWLRTTWGRRGVIAMFGKVEAGFEGTLTIPAFNASAQTLELPIGDRFCQIVFEKMHSPPEKSYAQRSGNYQGQRGVTLAKDAP